MNYSIIVVFNVEDVLGKELLKRSICNQCRLHNYTPVLSPMRQVSVHCLTKLLLQNRIRKRLINLACTFLSNWFESDFGILLPCNSTKLERNYMIKYTDDGINFSNENEGSLPEFRNVLLPSHYRFHLIYITSNATMIENLKFIESYRNKNSSKMSLRE